MKHMPEPTTQQLAKRLAVLRQEFETGQAQLRELEMRGQSLRETLLRISGAIQVIEELLSDRAAPED